MKALLDENIPVALARRLREDGWEVEHAVLSGRRGLPDAHFIELVTNEAGLVFLTQDGDFASIPSTVAGQVVLSRVRQERPLAERVALWITAFASLRREDRPERLFELLDDGQLVAWEIHDS